MATSIVRTCCAGCGSGHVTLIAVDEPAKVMVCRRCLWQYSSAVVRTGFTKRQRRKGALRGMLPMTRWLVGPLADKLRRAQDVSELIR